MKTEIKAWNKKTGTAYVFCEKTEHGNFYLVSSKPNGAPWIVDADFVTFTEPSTETNNNLIPKRSRSEAMIGNQNAKKHSHEN